MTKMVSALGLLVALSLGAIAWIGASGSNVMAGQDSQRIDVCAAATQAADDGYEINRRIQDSCARR